MKYSKFAPTLTVLAAVLALTTGCSKTSRVGGTSGDATPETLKVNAEFAKNLNLADQADYSDARVAQQPYVYGTSNHPNAK